MSDKKKIITPGKRATDRSSSYEKCKRNIKIKREKQKQSPWRVSVKKIFLEMLQNSGKVCQSLVLINLLAAYYFARNFIIDF